MTIKCRRILPTIPIRVTRTTPHIKRKKHELIGEMVQKFAVMNGTSVVVKTVIILEGKKYDLIAFNKYEDSKVRIKAVDKKGVEYFLYSNLKLKE